MHQVFSETNNFYVTNKINYNLTINNQIISEKFDSCPHTFNSTTINYSLSCFLWKKSKIKTISYGFFSVNLDNLFKINSYYWADNLLSNFSLYTKKVIFCQQNFNFFIKTSILFKLYSIQIFINLVYSLKVLGNLFINPRFLTYLSLPARQESLKKRLFSLNYRLFNRHQTLLNINTFFI